MGKHMRKLLEASTVPFIVNFRDAGDYGFSAGESRRLSLTGIPISLIHIKS
jgi:hypothetical protein